MLPPREIGNAANNIIGRIKQMIAASGSDGTFREEGRGEAAGEFFYENVGFSFSSVKPGARITFKQAVDVLGGINDAAWDPERRYDEPARILISKRFEEPEYEPYAFCYFVGDAWIPPDELKALENSSAGNQTLLSSSNGNFTGPQQTVASDKPYETYKG